MFDFVRRHTKIMMGGLFLLVIPAFVLVGVNSYTSASAARGPVVATVAGTDIHQGEWDVAHQREVERIRASNPALDAKLLDSAPARQATLDRLVREHVLRNAAEHDRLVITDAQLARALHDDPTIASLRRPDGTLDMQGYRQMLAGQGLSPAGFEARVRADLSTRQVLEGVVGSAFVPPLVADLTLDALFERREVRVANFLPADFKASVTTPTDAELQSYYDGHLAEFKAPESANVEYVVLDLAAVQKQLVVSDADLKTYYEQNATRYSTKPQRRASHILITAPKSATAAEREKARADAERLLAEARQPGADFAALAKQNSQDPGSAADGGDLGFFGPGDMVKPFEEAAFALQPSSISDVVESDFGYHIIKVTDAKPAVVQSFQQVRPEIERQLKVQRAAGRFAELAETFSNLVYEQPDSLKPVAERLELDIRTADNLTWQPTAGVNGVLANPKFLAALFAADTLRDKRNTQAIDLGNSQLVAGRVVSHQPARTLPLADVKDRVREQLIDERAAQLAASQGQQKLAAWKADAGQQQLGAPVVVSRTNAQQLAPAVVDAALTADPARLPTLFGVDLGAQGYTVVSVTKRIPRELPADAGAQQRQVLQSLAAAQALAYYDVLKAQAEVRIKSGVEAPR